VVSVWQAEAMCVGVSVWLVGVVSVWQAEAMCVGVPVWLVGVVSVWQAEAVLQPATRIPPQPVTPKLQHASKQEHTTNVVIK